MRGRGDGHTSGNLTKQATNRAGAVQYARTFLNDERERGWVFHYHVTDNNTELQAALAWLGLTEEHTCPEFQFTPCYWNFFPAGKGLVGVSPLTSYIEGYFAAHNDNLIPSLERVLTINTDLKQLGFELLAIKNAPPKTDDRTTQTSDVQKQRISTPSPYKYDVAFSFAGEDRALVETLDNAAKSEGFSTFYDKDQSVALWGSDLSVTLDDVYRKQSRYCVILISAAYVKKMWPAAERRSILARFIQERGRQYVLPVIIEDVDVPGLPPTIGYLKLQELGIDCIAEMLVAKLRSPGPVAIH
jgi:hypothetical protein